MSETNITRSLRIFKLCYVRGHLDIAKDVALSIFGDNVPVAIEDWYNNAQSQIQIDGDNFDFGVYYNANKSGLGLSPAPEYNTIDINFYYNSESGHFLEYDSNGNLVAPVEKSPTFEIVDDEHHIDLSNDLSDGDKLEIRVLDDGNTFQDAELEVDDFECSRKYKYLPSESTVKADDITLINGGYHFDGPNKYFTRHDKFGVHSDVFSIKEAEDEQENHEAVITEEFAIDEIENEDENAKNVRRQNTFTEHVTREPEKEIRSQKIKVNNVEKDLFQVPTASRDFFKDYIQLDDEEEVNTLHHDKTLEEKQAIRRKNKRDRRKRSLKTLFKQHKKEMLKFTRDELGLQPDLFEKSNVVVVDAGQTLDKATLNTDEGFYAVLEKGEHVSVKLPNRTVTYRRLDTCDEKYVLTMDNSVGLAMSKKTNCNHYDITKHNEKYVFHTNETQYLVPDDELVIDGQVFFIGSVGEGGTVDNSNTVSNICLVGSTLIETDQGKMPISKINNFTTINGIGLQAFTKSFYGGSQLVKIKKDSLRRNYPNRDTYVTPEHSIYLNKSMITAKRLADKGKVKGVGYVPYDRDIHGRVFNLLFRKWMVINANNIPVETLHPQFEQMGITLNFV